MDRDEVGLHQERFEVGRELHTKRLGPVFRHVRIERDDAHAEGQGSLRHHGPHPSQPHHPDRLAVQLDSLEPLPLPRAGPEGGVGLRHVAGLSQEEGDGVLGSGDDVRLRRVHHGDPAAGGRLDVHVVEPDAGPADDLERRGAIQDLFGDLRLGPDDEGVVGTDRVGQPLLGKLRPDVDLALLPQEPQAALGERLGHQDLHGEEANTPSAAATAAPRFTGYPIDSSVISRAARHRMMSNRS